MLPPLMMTPPGFGAAFLSTETMTIAPEVTEISVLAPSPLFTVTIEREIHGSDAVYFHAGGWGFWEDGNRGWLWLRAIAPTSAQQANASIGSIDLVDLKRMGLLEPTVGGRIRAITWKCDDGGLDKLGVFPAANGIRFVKRDDEDNLAGLFVTYTNTPTMFGGYRKWFACPECRRPAPSSTGSTPCGVGDAED